MTDAAPRGARRPATPADQIASSIRERIAAGELRAAGLVETIPGRGAIVRERRAAVSPAAQLERMHATGRIRLPNEHTVVHETGEMDSAKVDSAIVAALEQTPQSGPMIYRRRVVHRDGEPVCVATSWWGATVLSPQPGWREVRGRLLSHDLVPQGTPMLIAGLVGEDPVREDYVASAEVASTMEADLLGVRPGAAVLRVVTTMSGETWPLECGVYTYAAGTPVDFPSLRYSA